MTVRKASLVENCYLKNKRPGRVRDATRLAKRRENFLIITLRLVKGASELINYSARRCSENTKFLLLLLVPAETSDRTSAPQCNIVVNQDPVQDVSEWEKAGGLSPSTSCKSRDKKLSLN
jgi:hypothetical protein